MLTLTNAKPNHMVIASREQGLSPGIPGAAGINPISYVAGVFPPGCQMTASAILSAGGIVNVARFGRDESYFFLWRLALSLFLYLCLLIFFFLFFTTLPTMNPFL